VDNVPRIQTQGKPEVGFGKATICIDFRPVELEGNIGKIIKGKEFLRFGKNHLLFTG
jgi:hypothetical protein